MRSSRTGMDRALRPKSWLLVLGAVLSSAACGAEQDTSAARDAKSVGVMEAALQLPSGMEIRQLDYAISGGPENITRSDTVDLEHSSGIRFRIGALPIGPNYVLQVSAQLVFSGEQGAGVPCVGSGTYEVQSGGVSAAHVNLTCGGAWPEQDTAGDIQANAEVVFSEDLRCPVVTGISSLPLEVNVGATIALQGSASSPASLRWYADSNEINSSAGSLSFRCGEFGPKTLTVVASKAGCADSSASVEVHCGLATCGQVALNGAQPFGVRTVLAPGPGVPFPPGVRVEYDLYFPRGRVAGEPAMLFLSGQGDATRHPVLADLSVQLTAFDGCQNGFAGRLVGATDVIMGEQSYRLSGPSDAVMTVEFPAQLCAEGEIPPPSLWLTRDARLLSGLLPTEALWVAPSGPVEPASVSGARVGTTTMRYRAEPFYNTVAATLEPLGKLMAPGPATLDVSGLRDVLGRRFAVSDASFEVLRPSLVLTDLSFATRPPTGAVLGDLGCVRFEAGLLRCLPEYLSPFEHQRDFGLIMRLPQVTGATRLRIRHRALLAGSPLPARARVVIVAADGIGSELALTGDMADHTAPLLGPAPHYLVVDEDETTPTGPCSFPSRFTPQGYELDELQLLP